MEVYVLSNYWDTPDNEGHEILGVYHDFEDATEAMRVEAERVAEEYGLDFWQEDMTWRGENEIHLGHDPRMFLDPATIYCWRIDKMEVR